MEYTVNELAQLSGVSGRTLRYYDSIDLLKPARIARNGYRIYGQEQVDRLQQILFYRAWKCRWRRSNRCWTTGTLTVTRPCSSICRC